MKKIRKAQEEDIEAVAAIYNAIHDEIEQGRYAMKWFRDMYPTKGWARERVMAGDLYVMEDDDSGVMAASRREMAAGGYERSNDELIRAVPQVVASVVINHNPLPEYFIGRWHQPEDYSRITVVHTLVVHPGLMHRGYATAIMKYVEDVARRDGSERIRLDTQAMDVPARNLYRKLGYIEADRVPCEFKGITDIDLYLIEKIL